MEFVYGVAAALAAISTTIFTRLFVSSNRPLGRVSPCKYAYAISLCNVDSAGSIIFSFFDGHSMQDRRSDNSGTVTISGSPVVASCRSTASTASCRSTASTASTAGPDATGFSLSTRVSRPSPSVPSPYALRIDWTIPHVCRIIFSSA